VATTPVRLDCEVVEDGAYPHALPEEPTLAEAARALEDGRLAGEVLDADWRLRYVSSELRSLVGFDDDDQLGYGVLAMARATIAPEVWRLGGDSRLEWWKLEGPYFRHDVPSLKPESDVPGEFVAGFEQTDPASPPIAWAMPFLTTYPDGFETSVGRLVVRLIGPEGLVGLMSIYVGGGLRGSVQALLSRGDDAMFERMALLTEPARRAAAVLFCDLQDSGVHSRKLSSKAYFELIRELTTEIDHAVIAEGGIVGKHVGDGVSAFFIAEQLGGEEEAARRSIESARRVQRAVSRLEAGSGPISVNIGVHWGATLVIGQVVTGGRLEVTALGDEVNQAARIQEVCRGGGTLISKDVVERLDPEAAAGLGVDPASVAYEIVAELPNASEKVKRDAGGLAVTAIEAPDD
jgi:class 3 adenylate cyclase